MSAQTGAFGRDGIKYSGDAVRDVVFHDIMDKKRCEIDAYHGKHQIEPVVRRDGKTFGQQELNLTNNPMKDEGCDRSEKSDKERQDYGHLFVADVFFAPTDDFSHKTLILYRCFHYLFADDAHFTVLTQFDDATGGMGLVFLSAGPTDIIHRVNQLLADVAIVLCGFFTAYVCACTHDGLLESIAKLM